jgi:hypothetical protein
MKYLLTTAIVSVLFCIQRAPLPFSVPRRQPFSTMRFARTLICAPWSRKANE